MSRRVHAWSCTKGAAAVEMALVLPFLIVLLFGSVELGYYFYNQHQVVKGLRDGARFASRQPFTLIGCNGASPVRNSGAVTRIQQLTVYGQLAISTPRVPGWAPEEVIVTVDCTNAMLTNTGIYRNQGNAPVIRLTTSFPYRPLFGGLGVVTSQFRLNAKQEAAGMGI